MSKHTPGPWRTGSCDGSMIWAREFRSIAWKDSPPTVNQGEGAIVAVVEDPTFGKIERLRPGERFEDIRAEAEANARLIAAAPDMLEALRQIIEQTTPFKNEKHGVVPYVRRLAQSAMAKATGTGEITARRHRTDVEFFWLADHDAGMSEDHVSGVMFDQGQGVVCQICSAFHGGTFWAANVPSLDPDSDQDELITADTEEECARMVANRLAALATRGAIGKAP